MIPAKYGRHLNVPMSTFPAKKDVKPVQPPLESPNEKEWTHSIARVSKMADWKKADSVMCGFVDLLTEYRDGTPEIN